VLTKTQQHHTSWLELAKEFEVTNMLRENGIGQNKVLLIGLYLLPGCCKRQICSDMNTDADMGTNKHTFHSNNSYISSSHS